MYVVAGARHALLQRSTANSRYTAPTVAGIRRRRQAAPSALARNTQRLVATSSAIRTNSSTASGSIASATATNGVTSNTEYTASAVRKRNQASNGRVSQAISDSATLPAPAAASMTERSA